MKIEKRFKIVILVIACIFCAVTGSMIYRTNRDISDVSEKIYEPGEKVFYEDDLTYIENMNGYAVKVISAEVKTKEQFLEDYHASPEDIPESVNTPKIYDLEVEVSNEDNTDTGIYLWELQLQKNAAYGAFSEIHYRIANADKGYRDSAIAIKPGTAVTMHWIFILPEKAFTRSAYENIEALNMKLVLTLYPVKKMISLQ